MTGGGYTSGMTENALFDESRPLALLAACPAYRPTPLRQHVFCGRSIRIKDETARMGLGAFKALGGAYAVARLIERECGRSLEPRDFLSDEVRAVAAGMTFVCASAGNHGMSVAAGARIFGAKARIHLSDTVPGAFFLRLTNMGAGTVRSGRVYEESVTAAIADAQDTGAVHLADGSWPGYEEPPRLVMEGYTVMAEEMRRSFKETGEWPSHVFLQAGVGGLAAAIAFMIRKNWPIQPEIIVVEPEAAPCLAESVRAGKMVTVEGPASNMGRLDCKTPSMIAFDILREAADRFETVSDDEAAQAARQAGALGLATTPSGAAGLACFAKDRRDMPRPLAIVSEGPADTETMDRTGA